MLIGREASERISKRLAGAFARNGRPSRSYGLDKTCESFHTACALSGRSVSRKISRIPRSRGFCQALSSFEFDAGKLVEKAHFEGIFVSRTMHLWVIAEGVLVLTPPGRRVSALHSGNPAKCMPLMIALSLVTEWSCHTGLTTRD